MLRRIKDTWANGTREKDEVNDMDEKDFKGFFRNRSTIWTLSLCMTGIIVLGGISAMDKTRRAADDLETEDFGEYAMLDERARELNDTLDQPIDEEIPGMDDVSGEADVKPEDTAQVSVSDVIEQSGQIAGAGETHIAEDVTAENSAGWKQMQEASEDGSSMQEAVGEDSDVQEAVREDGDVQETVREDSDVQKAVGDGEAQAANSIGIDTAGMADEVQNEAEAASVVDSAAVNAQENVEAAASSSLISEQTLLAAGIDFTADTDMLMWPAAGTILIDYSMDSSVYFPTLNQYKYNPAVVIGSDAGNQVLAATKGIVESIYNDEETGTTLVMNIGNGYRLTYGQLQGLTVGEGDVVEEGALIGYIGQPTKYYTKEGSNLYFAVTENGEAVDPMLFLN